MTLGKVGKILLYGSAGIIGACSLAVLAAKLALDRAPRYQAEIKDWVHEQIGYHIAFAHVSPAFRRYGPELYFERLELRSKDDLRVLARAAGGRIGLDVWQLVHSGKLLAGRIELDSPAIAIARLGPDKFALASEIELRGGESSLPALTLDDLPAGTLAIRRGLVVIQNWNPALPRLELREVNLDLRRGDELALAAAALLPPVLGGDVSVNGTARGLGPVDALNWTVLVRARRLSLAGWRELLPAYLSRLNGGRGEFELAARGRGAEVARADLDCSAADVTTQLGDEPGVKFDRLSGVFTFTHSLDRWTLAGRRLRALEGERQDPESQFEASWREGAEGLLELRARASYLRIETLLPLAGLLPQKDIRERLQEVAPSGEWFDTHVDMLRGATGSAWQFNVGARFRGLGFAPVGRAPGLRGLNGMIAGTQSGGRIDIDTRQGVFDWPAQLAQPIDLTELHTTLYWKRTLEDLVVATPGIELKNHDAAVQARVAWRQPADGDSPVLTLAASIDEGNVAQTHRYLPRALLPPSVFAWLNRALVAGRLSHADLVVNGPIRHFPFRDGSGLFLARAHLEATTIDYREGWPRAETLAGVAEFRNAGLDVQFRSGNLGTVPLGQGGARFVDFKTGELKLHFVAAGDAADALGYLRATPLDAMAGQAFSGVEASGPMQADVDLYLPFKQFDLRRVLVHAHLHGVTLKHPGLPLAASELSGDVDIDGAQVAHAEVRGRLLGGYFLMQGRSSHNRPVARTLLAFNGTFSGDALHEALSLPASLPVGGSADWRGMLRWSPEPSRERSLRINTTLSGLELNLPEPLAKPVGRPLPSSVEIGWPSGGGARLNLTLGSLLKARVNLDSGTDGPTLAQAAVTFGASASAEPAFSDTQVLNAGGTIDRLDLAGWLRLYTPDKNAKPIANFLHSAKFEVAQIDYLGLSFMDVALDLAAIESGWRIGVGGPNVVGTLLLPAAAESPEPWKLEFKRLKFTDSLSDAPSNPGVGVPNPGGAAQEANPRRIPAINFHAAEAIWDERQLGDVQATLAKLDDGISLRQLTMSGASFTVAAHGDWRGRDSGIGRIGGTLESTDVGATLKQLGYAAVIEAKSGKMDFKLSWSGAPTADAFRDAKGHVEVAIDKGQITRLDPGAGRVVGLASVAALPRRLALDFSDLTDKGFAFDTARGDFELHDGSAYTDDVLIKGPAAEIGLIGRIGLKNKDYDQTAEVTGNVSNTLPLAAFAAGPVIGGAVLIFSQVFKQPLKGLARAYYRITGGWDNPTIERIKGGDAAAAATAEAPK
jgi:uncharacterized protein (TIGR02099 family)